MEEPKREEILNQVLQSIQGNVHSQGVRVDIRAWLDPGSKEWGETPDEVKAAAYQAAQNCGWTDASLKANMMRSFGHIDSDLMDYVLKTLKDFSKEYPFSSKEIFATKGQDHVNFRDAERGDTGGS